MKNIDDQTVAGFGDEWARFDQSRLSDAERLRMFSEYFAVFPWNRVGKDSVGADIGCGSGRWAVLVAPRVGTLHCVDPSDAIDVAAGNCRGLTNLRFHRASVDELPFDDGTLDFAYCLGVLHHVPDTAAAVQSIARKLKTGAPLLLYLYYAFENRPWWFRAIWRASDLLRRGVARLPGPLRYGASQLIAVGVYWPLARTAKLLESLGMLPSSFPLSAYRNRSFYSMRTDALDRFGTRLEQRFTRSQIDTMLRAAGFGEIVFSDRVPFWCVVGTRQQDPRPRRDSGES